MVRLGKKVINDLELVERFYKEWNFYRENDVPGLEVIDRVNSPEVIYYPGPYYDLMPVIVLDSGKDYFYQERHVISHSIESALGVLKENGVITELRKIDSKSNGNSHPEFTFLIANSPKNLHIFDNSDINDGVIPQISDADMVYGYNSLVTEDMLQKAKQGCLILDHPGAGGNYLNNEQIRKHNLIKIIYPHSDKSIFNWSHFYKKR